MKKRFLSLTPYFIQNSFISIFNYYQYKIRHGGKYHEYKSYYAWVESISGSQLSHEIELKKASFFKYVSHNSPWYKDYDLQRFYSVRMLEKIDIINNLNSMLTLKEKEGVVSLTGGTTGASMKVIYTKEDMQERFAIIDHFRAKHGYELGKKTAWFSGKNLISQKDIKKGICSHYDFINKIRFYSTFHINHSNFDVYWKSLNEFQPEFLVGFPSSVYEICEIADSKGLKSNYKVKVFFPTAETVLPKHREVIGRVLGCKLVDQYASSEGAPFILECTKGNLHIHPLTGIFEVIDEYMQPAEEGELLVTSFTTHGTPLIRYRVGDRIKLDTLNKQCDCGSSFPLVDKIEGRSTDYILSPTHGKVNLGNISNSTKDVIGIIQFQVIQQELNHVKVLVVATNKFSLAEKNKFKTSLAERFGDQIAIELKIVNEITKEKSGKFRLVKNLII
ncbi:phenylacetate--CoA ligase family protein [Psychrobacter arenosus]|uniref:phenylacetate--CoA ligase family protein n=1 Tax=Psychrobacter arenosus TaxID=256326 RepID=UPI0039F0F528